MAKSRIDRRGKIRSMVRKRPAGRGPHWSVTKREAVWRRRRIIDDVWLFDIVDTVDAFSLDVELKPNSATTTTDFINIDDQKLVVSSFTSADLGGIEKDFLQPDNTSSTSVTDVIGFEKSNFNIQFNNNVFNFALLNGLAYDQTFATDVLNITEELSFTGEIAKTSDTTVTDFIGFNFIITSVLNVNAFGTQQLNT